VALLVLSTFNGSIIGLVVVAADGLVG